MTSKLSFLKIGVSFFVGLMFLLLVITPHTALAGVYDANTPVTYKEYWVNHDQFDGGCPPADPVPSSDRWYIEPRQAGCQRILEFVIPDDFSNALRAEIYLDLWRNHDEHAIRYRINDGLLRSTDVGLDWSRTPYVATIPFGELRQGTNTIYFTNDGSSRLAHVHDILIRIYYDNANPLIAGSGGDVTAPTAALGGIRADNGFFAPAAGGTLMVDSNQLVITATASSDITHLEFHAFYDGADLDNDGNFREWQSRTRQNCNPGGSTGGLGCVGAKPAVGGTIDHIGSTGPAGTFSNCSWNAATNVATCTWDLKAVINQSGVRFKVRALDAAGNVSEAAGGVSNEFTLLRNNPTAAFINPNFTDAVLHHGGDSGFSDEYTTQVELPANISQYDVAYLLGSYFHIPNIYVNNSSQFMRPFAQNSTNPQDDIWTLSTREIPGFNVVGGTNTIRYAFSFGWGQFIEAPGPMIVLRGTGGLSDSSAPTVTNVEPTANSINVERKQTVVAILSDAGGVGIDYTSLAMKINGNSVAPQISGFSNQYQLSYAMPGGFAADSLVTVEVNAQDLLGNVMSPHSFSFTVEPLDVTPPAISNVQVISGFTQVNIKWVTDEPATSRVDFGTSSSYTDVVSNPDLVTEHSLVLDDLAPDTEYHFAITSADGDNNSTVTSDGTFRTQAGQPTVSDDFNYCELDPMWEFVDPRGDATLTLTGQELVISVPGGIEHDIWNNGTPIIRAPHLLQNATNPDRTSVKFSSGVNAGIAQQGLLAIQDAQNFLRVNFQYDAGGVRAYVIRVRNGTPQILASPAVAGVNPNGPLYLQLLRDENNRWVPRYSADGENWTVINIFTEIFAITKVGVYAGNAALNGVVPPVEAVIDYFFNDAAPIVDEDATAQQLPVSAEPSDKGTVLKDVDCGNPVTVTAVPVPGWSFANWNGAVNSSENPLQVSFDYGDFVVATFTQDEYTVITDTVGSGSVSYTPQSATYVYSDTVSFTANPAIGWEFAGWSGALSGSANPAELQIGGNSTVTATFTAIPYTLDTTTIGSGSVTASPEQDTYIYGDEITLLATPIPGWSFSGWDGDATGMENPLVLTIAGNTSVSAIFTKDAYTLDTTVSGGGTVSRNPEQSTYEYGTQVTLNVTTDTGWEFVRWSGAITSTVNPTTITMQGNVAVTAVLTKTRHSLTDAVIGNGSLLVTPEKSVYLYGDEVTITAVPAAGWTLESWSGDASGKANPITLVMDGNKSIVATFVEAPFALTTSVTGEGSIERSPDLESFKDGDTVVLTAVPAAGWSFTGWSGATSGNENPLTITMDSDKTVSANFVQEAYTVAVDVQSAISNTNPAANTVTLTPDQATYTYGTAVTVSAVSADGWTFARWSGDLDGTEPVMPMTVTADLDITAIFTPTLYELDYEVVGGQGGEGGRIEASKAGPYIHGEVITLTAVADEGYVFAEWVIEEAQAAGTSADESQITVTIPDNRTFRARFVEAANKIFLPFMSR